jgi:hypothetical protein
VFLGGSSDGAASLELTENGVGLAFRADRPKFRYRLAPVRHDQRAPLADAAEVRAETHFQFPRTDDIAFHVVIMTTFQRPGKP